MDVFAHLSGIEGVRSRPGERNRKPALHAVATCRLVGGFQCDDLGQADQAVLGGDIRALVRAGDQRVDAADVDDAPVAGRAHAGQERAAEPRGAGQHHIHQQGPALHREIFQRGNLLQAGVVDQHLRRARHARQGLRDAVVIGHVQRQRFGRAAGVAQALRGAFGRRQIHIADNQMVAVGGQLGGDAGADAAACAGDQDAALHAVLVVDRARPERPC